MFKLVTRILTLLTAYIQTSIPLLKPLLIEQPTREQSQTEEALQELLSLVPVNLDISNALYKFTKVLDWI